MAEASRPAFAGNLGSIVDNEQLPIAGPRARRTALRSSGCTFLEEDAIIKSLSEERRERGCDQASVDGGRASEDCYRVLSAAGTRLSAAEQADRRHCRAPKSVALRQEAKAVGKPHEARQGPK